MGKKGGPGSLGTKTLEEQYLPEEFDRSNRYISDNEDNEHNVDELDSDEADCADKPLDLMDQGYVEQSVVEQHNRGNNNERKHTGPKGVLADYRDFKTEQRQALAERMRALEKGAKRLVLNNPVVDEEKSEDEEDYFKDFDKDETFMKQYLDRRMQEISHVLESQKRFGHLKEITSDMFVDEIDKEDREVYVVIHLYEKMIPSCQQMNFCLKYMAQDFPRLKFCCITASQTSDKFRNGVGLPALLIYKDGVLVHNFVEVREEIGADFAVTEIQDLLTRCGILGEYDVRLANEKRSAGAPYRV